MKVHKTVLLRENPNLREKGAGKNNLEIKKHLAILFRNGMGRNRGTAGCAKQRRILVARLENQP